MRRFFVSKAKNDQRYLPGLEFARITHKNAVTKHTPFFLAYGEHQFSLADPLLSDSSAFSDKAVGLLVEDIENVHILRENSYIDQTTADVSATKETSCYPDVCDSG